MKTTIIIRKDGHIEWLKPPPFPMKVRQVSKQRFSEILPVNPVKRMLFKLLRRCFGEEGRVSDWTRSWTCRWRAEILTGPNRGKQKESGLRCVLLEWESRQFKPK